MRSLRTGSCLALAALCLTLSARGAGLEKLVPGDSDVVVILNVKQALDSKLFKKYGEEKLKDLLKRPEAEQFIKLTGLDPMKDIDAVLLAGKIELPNGKKAVIAVRGKFDEAKIKNTLEAVAKEDKIKLDTSKEGALAVYAITPEKAGKDDKAYLAFADKNTAVISPLKDLAVEVASGKVGKPSAKMVAALGKYTGKETLFGAFVMGDDIKALAKDAPGVKEFIDKVDGAILSVTYTDGVAANLTVNTSDEDTAAAIKLAVGTGLGVVKKQALDQAAAIPGAADLVKELFEKDIKVTRDGVNVTASLNIPADTIDKIEKTIKDAMK